MITQTPGKNNANRPDSLKQKIKKIVEQEDLSASRLMLTAISKDLDISEQDCAAALMLLQQPELIRKMKLAAELQQAKSLLDMKMVRYRLEVGHKNMVSIEAVKRVMIDEAGLEHGMIGYIDIQSIHTVISLPEGMPAEIFQLLKEIEINQQALKISRLGGKNRNSARAGNKYNRNRRRKSRSASKNDMVKNQSEKKPLQAPRILAENEEK
jgi:ATP-dependent RNA helicase DeaD